MFTSHTLPLLSMRPAVFTVSPPDVALEPLRPPPIPATTGPVCTDADLVKRKTRRALACHAFEDEVTDPQGGPKAQGVMLVTGYHGIQRIRLGGLRQPLTSESNTEQQGRTRTKRWAVQQR